MSMVRQKWSVSALSNELGVDRRTIARRLHDVKPAGNGPRGPLYLMSDVYRALTTYCGACSTAERRDLVAREFIQHVGKPRGLDALAGHLISAPTSEARVRVLREFFASQLWGFIRGRKDPAAPAWASVSERRFERAWRALARDREPLADVAVWGVGVKPRGPGRD